MADEGIKYSEIVPDDAFNKLKKDGEDLIKIFTNLGNVIKQSMSGIKIPGNAPKSVGDVESANASIKKIGELSAAHDKVVKSLSALQKENEKIRLSEIQLQQAREKAFDKFEKEQSKKAQSLQKENEKIRELNRPYVQMSQTLNKLRKDYQDLAVSGRDQGKVAKALAAEIQNLDSKLKNVDATVGLHQRNVGNYKSALTDLKGGLLDIGNALGIAFGAHQIAEFGKESVQAFLEAEKNATDLKNALHGNTAAFNTLMEQSAELQDRSIFSDDDIQQAQKAMAVYGLTAEQIEKITPQVADLASKLGIDMASATDKVISGINGQTKGLKEAGIAFKDTGSKTENFNILTEKLTKFQGASAEALETTIGKTKRLENAFDDFKEQVGEFLVNQGSSLLDFFEGLGSGFDAVNLRNGSEIVVKILNEGNKKILSDAQKSEAARLKAITETEARIRTLSEKGLAEQDLVRKKGLEVTVKNQLQLLQDLKHLNDKQEIEDDATNAAKLEKEDDYQKRLRDLRTGNKDNEYEREKQVIIDQYNDAVERDKNHAEIIVELKIKLKNDLDAIDQKYFAKEKADAEKHNGEMVAIGLDGLSGGLKEFVKTEKDKEDKKKAARQKEIDDEIELTGKLLKLYDERYQRIAQLQRDQTDAEIDSAESNMEIQAQLAARGLQNTLAYEMNKKAELERLRVQQIEDEKKHAQEMEAAELGLAFIQAYQGYVEKDVPAGQALSKAAADIFAAKIFSKVVAGAFAEGVEDFKGKGTGTSDSNLIAFSAGESVVTAKGTADTPGLVTAVNEKGMAGAVDWVYKQQFDSGIQLSDVSRKQQGDQAHTMLLVKKIDDLTQEVKNKPVPSLHMDNMYNLVHTTVQNGMKHVTVKKRHLS